jgi:hypothetical protein
MTRDSAGRLAASCRRTVKCRSGIGYRLSSLYKVLNLLNLLNLRGRGGVSYIA